MLLVSGQLLQLFTRKHVPKLEFANRIHIQFARKSSFDSIDERTGLIAGDLIAKLQRHIGLGRGQVVRHRFLVSCIVGSNPTAPANHL